MSEPHHETNGKATLGLISQVTAVVLGGIFTIATPLILMYTRITALEVQLTEVETQFKAADDYRNINLTSQMRLNSLMWQKAYGEPFPSEMYFPSISNRK